MFLVVLLVGSLDPETKLMVFSVQYSSRHMPVAPNRWFRGRCFPYYPVLPIRGHAFFGHCRPFGCFNKGLWRLRHVFTFLVFENKRDSGSPWR
jgi:hypothetical protein